jgi:N-acetylneuraminic acid mutarotase
MVYITGGQRNDGSGTVLADAYAFNPNTSTFTALPNLPRGTAHHVSAFLPNGTLVVLTGIYTSGTTGNPALRETTTIYSLDTNAATPAWWEGSAGGTAPPPRRGASGVMMAEDKMYVLGGTGMQSAEAMGDLWEMDMKAGTWSQVSSSGNGESRARAKG